MGLQAIDVKRHLGAVNYDNFVARNTIQAFFSGSELRRTVKFYLVECSSGLVAQIDIPVGYPPLAGYVVFHLSKKPK